MKRYLEDEQATIRLARELSLALPETLSGWTILLKGELGAGKSTFARAFIHALGHEGAVPSPTYTLIEPYALTRGEVYHIDLYRLASEEELHYLGWSELDQGCRLIEWPDRVPSLSDAADLVLELRYDGAGRRARLVGASPRAADIVARLRADPKT